MKKGLLIFAIATFSLAYIYFFVGIPSNDVDSGFAIKCFKDRYHTYRIDESFIETFMAEGRFGTTKNYRPSSPLADAFLYTACRYGLPSEIPEQEKMLEQVKKDMDSFKIPVGFKGSNKYDIYYYPGTLNLIPDASGIAKLIFLLFIDGLILLWIKK